MSNDLFDPPEIRDQLWFDVQRGYLAWDISHANGHHFDDLLDRFRYLRVFDPDPDIAAQLTREAPTITVHSVAIDDHDGDLPWADLGRVPCRSIDSLIHVAGLERPDFIKVDVLGREHAVLRGAQSLIKLYRPQWLIEFYSAPTGDDCRQLLEDCGYRTSTVRHPYYRPGSAPWLSHGWLKTTPSD